MHRMYRSDLDMDEIEEEDLIEDEEDDERLQAMTELEREAVLEARREAMLRKKQSKQIKKYVKIIGIYRHVRSRFCLKSLCRPGVPTAPPAPPPARTVSTPAPVPEWRARARDALPRSPGLFRRGSRPVFVRWRSSIATRTATCTTT